MQPDQVPEQRVKARRRFHSAGGALRDSGACAPRRRLGNSPRSRPRQSFPPPPWALRTPPLGRDGAPGPDGSGNSPLICRHERRKPAVQKQTLYRAFFGNFPDPLAMLRFFFLRPPGTVRRGGLSQCPMQSPCAAPCQQGGLLLRRHPSDTAGMGLTTASLHVYAPAMAAESAAGRLRAMVCGSGGWVEDAAAEDRVIAVLASESCPWLSIYDTGLLEPDSSAAKLSRALDRPVVAVVVEDSDRYSITLFVSGKRVDRITAAVSRRRGSGHPDKWVSVLPHVSARDLAGGMEGGGTFAEEALRRAAAALGLPFARTAAVAEEAVRAPSAARLCFRRAATVHEPAGAPVLVCGSIQALPAAAGRPLNCLIVPVANRGAETRGVRVRLSGPALEQGLIAPEAIHAFRIVRNPDGTAGGPASNSPLVEGAHGFLAEMPDVELPYQPDPRTLGNQLRARKTMDDFLSRTVHLSIQGRAVQPGEAPLHIRIECLKAACDPLTVELPVRIAPAG